MRMLSQLSVPTMLLLAPILMISAGAGGAAEPHPQPQAALSAPNAAAHSVATLDLETLTLESDFTPFMRRDCPEPLRRRALRKLWSLLPQAADAGPTTF